MLASGVGIENFGKHLSVKLGGCRTGADQVFLQTLASELEKALGVVAVVEASKDYQWSDPGFEGDVAVCGSAGCFVTKARDA